MPAVWWSTTPRRASAELVPRVQDSVAPQAEREMTVGPFGPVSTLEEVDASELEELLKVRDPWESSAWVGEVVMTWAVTRSAASVPWLETRISISSTGSSQTGSAEGRPAPALSAPVSSSTSPASAATMSSSTSRSYHSPQVPSAWERPRTRIC